MPEIDIEIGGREFAVACQSGEEPYLQAAAKMLDAEAQGILTQVGRMPTDRMLLMAGLMLADKTAAVEEDLAKAQSELVKAQEALRAAEEKLDERARRITELQEEGGGVPEEVRDGLADLAARAEALAEELEAEAGD